MKTIAIALSLLLLYGCFYRAGIESHPSDSYFEEIFRKNKTHFERTVAMVKEDQIFKRIAPDFFHATGKWNTEEQKRIPDGELTENRWKEYKSLFRKTSSKKGIESSREGRFVSFIMETEGLSIGGSSKGITYTESTPENLLDSLEAVDTSAKMGFAFKHIEGPWYIELSWSN